MLAYTLFLTRQTKVWTLFSSTPGVWAKEKRLADEQDNNKANRLSKGSRCLPDRLSSWKQPAASRIPLAAGRSGAQLRTEGTRIQPLPLCRAGRAAPGCCLKGRESTTSTTGSPWCPPRAPGTGAYGSTIRWTP
ncbi:uncharacterized protein LOC130147895 isoform X1 [Falco biarmicus]|uniref:uncharacterized protein LOC130147895 isoform X1 n=1 Tax=Falco biarmicus TaxID=345155 RepID=UPI0024BCF6CB|nr:uncharacterized protein LOC130147895 isoform X1 [Falco biarmicus]